MTDHQVNLEMKEMNMVQPSCANVEVRTPQNTKQLVSISTGTMFGMLGMAFVTTLFVLRLFSFVTFGVFDMACFAYERKAVTNCSQKVFVSNPLMLVNLWLVTSNVISVIVLASLYARPPGITFCGFKFVFSKLRGNSSFWSLNLVFCIISIHYTVRFIHERGPVMEIVPVCLASLKLLNLLALYSINYVHPVFFPRGQCTLQKVFFWETYWLSLIFSFLENLYLLISSSLDAMENIYPLGSSQTETDRLFLVMLTLGLGANVTFQIRLVEFYWRKMFHGDKDLFSEVRSLENIPD